MTVYTGKTLEDVLEKAAEEKGCTTEDLRYHVLEEKAGLLGLGSEVTAEVYNMDDVKEFLFEYLGNFFTSIDQDIEVAIEQKQDNSFVVNLNAENNAVLIGKAGKTLSAFNTVVRSAVNAEFKERINVLIDINNYKDDRYAKIRSMAKRLAKQVQKTHTDVELDPLPSDERKVIHNTLTNWHNIRTESVGEAGERHTWIRYVPDEGEDVLPEESAEIDETPILYEEDYKDEFIEELSETTEAETINEE